MKPAPLQPSALFLDLVIPHLLQPLHTSAWGFQTLSFLLLFYWVGQKFHSSMEEAKMNFLANPVLYSGLCKSLWRPVCLVASLIHCQSITQELCCFSAFKIKALWDWLSVLLDSDSESHTVFIKLHLRFGCRRKQISSPAILILLSTLPCCSLNLFLLFTGRSLFCFG